MGIARNGWRTSKSLSPVIIQSAWTETASSRYLSSLGSRHALMETLGTKNSLPKYISSIISQRSPSFLKYESNFSRNKTSTNSARVWFEIAKIPKLMALRSAFLLTDSGIRAALIKLFVSKTKTLFIGENILQPGLSKATFFHSLPKVIKEFYKFILRTMLAIPGQLHFNFLFYQSFSRRGSIKIG